MSSASSASLISTTSSASATTSASASASAAAGTIPVPSNLKIVGIILAIMSGVLIGSSFVFKKKGLLRAQAGGTAGEGVGYLKSPLWWLGMTMMILGELCNFAAYSFVEAIVVTPMGALSVVICAILSSIFLKEKLTLFGWLGCTLCILGSVIIAMNGPEEPSVGQITKFQALFLSPGFLVYGSVLLVAALVIIFYFAPRYGKKSMLWYIMVCSMIGGISVSVTTGLGAAIVTTAMGDNQFKHWFIYFLMVFIAVTLITEVYYLNVALALFNTAMVTPTYYVIFTFFSIVTTIVLFRGLSAPASQIITLVMGFLVICVGITILQLSKIDPTQLKIPGLDRRSTMLLQAARSNTVGIDEKNIAAVEDPGMDTLRGSFGAMGSIIRARSARRMSMNSQTGSSVRARHGHHAAASDASTELPHYSAMGGPTLPEPGVDHLAGMKRHQLYDPPVSSSSGDDISLKSQPSNTFSPRKTTIKFGDEDVVHVYPVASAGREGSQLATHEHRSALSSHNAPGPYIPWDAQDASTSQLGLDIGVPRTAPLMSDPHRPPLEDPFANSPSTTTLSTFPSYSTTASVPYSDSSSSHRKLSRGPHIASIFTRTASGGRQYPRGHSVDDREESESLFHRPDTEPDSASDTDTDLPLHGSVRLVSAPKPE